MGEANALQHALHLIIAGSAFQRTGANDGSAHRIHLDTEAGRTAKLFRKLRGLHWSQFDDGVSALWSASRAHHHTASAQFQVGSIKEDDLTKFGVEHIDLRLKVS